MNSVKKRRRVHLVAEEISLAKILASNDKPTRERGVKKLGKWLSARVQAGCELSEDDMMRVWKGLFYCVWMADKPLVQEQMVESISRLVHAGGDDASYAAMFLSCCLRTLEREWLGIDHFRLDKFLMLVRRVLRQALERCRAARWAGPVLGRVLDVLSTTALSGGTARSLAMHVCEVFPVELAKVARGHLPPDTTLRCLQPFARYLAEEQDPLMRAHVVDVVFHHLVRQSEFGQECAERFEAWRLAGFPGTSWQQMRAVEEEEEEEEEGDASAAEEERSDVEQDPRAGSVHVQLKPLGFDSAAVAAMLLERRAVTFEPQNRRVLKELADDFAKMASGRYPLKLTKFTNMSKHVQEVRKALKRKRHTVRMTKKLVQFENGLAQQEGDVKKKWKRKQRAQCSERVKV